MLPLVPFLIILERMMPNGEKNENLRRRGIEWSDFVDSMVVAIITLIAYFLDKHELASLLALIGTMVVVSRFVIQEKIRSRIAELETNLGTGLLPLEQLQNYVDLTRTAHIHEIASILNLYSSITEPEFRAVKDKVLRDSSRRLEQLFLQKRSDELQTSAYYQWLLPMLDDIKPGEYLRAISLMNDAEWDDSQAERQFFQKHIAAAKRGVHIERIFIVNRTVFPNALSNEAVLAHTEEEANGINGFFLYRDWFEQHEPDSLKEVKDGFIIIGNRVALVDTFSPVGEVRGYVVMDAAEITRLIELFERLKIIANPLSSKIFNPTPPRQLTGQQPELPPTTS